MHITHNQAFVEEMLLVVAHVIRSVEERIRGLDLSRLVLDDVPGLVWYHVQCMELARRCKETGYYPELDLSDWYHGMSPHPGLTNYTKEYVDGVAEGMLAILLPTEDLASTCERVLIREILANLVLGSTIDAVSQPYIIHEMLQSACHTIKRILDAQPTWYKKILSLRQTAAPVVRKKTTRSVLRLYCVDLGLIIVGQCQRSSYLCKICTFLCGLVPRSSYVDRLGIYLSAQLYESVFHEELVLVALDTLRDIVWPKGVLMGPRTEPSAEEQAEIQRETERILVDTVPQPLRSLIFGASRKLQLDTAHDLLDTFDNAKCNKHLVFQLLDLITVKILPELADLTPREIMELRGVA